MSTSEYPHPEDRADYFSLPDGTRVCYHRYGKAGATPAFYFHGWPGCRLEGEFLARAAVDLDLCIYAVDRPGMGRSDFMACARIVDWAHVPVALADHLGLARFGVAAVSGGGPYALAVAACFPERVTRAVIAGCAARFEKLTEDDQASNRFDRNMVTLWRTLPWAGPCILNLYRLNLMWMPFVLANQPRLGFLSEPDRAVLLDGSIHEPLKTSVLEGLHQGTRGAIADLERLFGDWGFDPVDSPHIDLIYGELDWVVRPHPALRSLGSLGACGRTIPDHGHYSLPIRNTVEMLAPLART